jgi:hypothetical protein
MDSLYYLNIHLTLLKFISSCTCHLLILDASVNKRSKALEIVLLLCHRDIVLKSSYVSINVITSILEMSQLTSNVPLLPKLPTFTVPSQFNSPLLSSTT